MKYKFPVVASCDASILSCELLKWNRVRALSEIGGNVGRTIRLCSNVHNFSGRRQEHEVNRRRFG